tara:strand:+ start:2040 stop:2141 length:102 start_codon:yes stop_codon:yes gene_type:complete
VITILVNTALFFESIGSVLEADLKKAVEVTNFY